MMPSPRNCTVDTNLPVYDEVEKGIAEANGLSVAADGRGVPGND